MSVEDSTGSGSARPHDDPTDSGWADPGYFSAQSRLGNALRLLWQLLRPPKGHRIAPTATGGVLILLALALGTAAFNTAQNVFYIALALILASLIGSGVLSWFNLKGCQWRLLLPRNMRAGEAVPLRLQVRKAPSWLPSYCLEFVLGARSSGQQVVLTLAGPLEPQSEAWLEWSFEPVERGRETIVLEALVSRYPFGFLQKTIRDSLRSEAIIWPARCRYRWSPVPAGSAAAREGRRGNRHDGVELSRIRRYTPGDPLNRIHWKASAHAGTLLVKEFENRSVDTFEIEIEPFAERWPDADRFERMCSFAGTLAEDLFRHGQLAAWSIRGDLRKQVHNLADIHALLDRLACLAPMKSGPAGGMVGSGRRLQRIRFHPASGGRVNAFIEGRHAGST